MATYTAIAAGGNWNTAATWGGTGVQYPHAGDTAIINATMTGTVTIDAASACATLNMTSNAGTLAFSTFNLTISAATTLYGTMTCSSAASIIVQGGGVTLAGNTGVSGLILQFTTAGGTLTSGGFTWAGNTSFSYAGTYVLSGNWINTGLTTFSAAAIVNKTTAETFTLNGGLTAASSTGAGNAVLVIGGAGTITGSSSYNVVNPLTFNYAGTITAATDQTFTGLVTFSAATILSGVHNFICNAGVTLSSNTGTGSTTTLQINAASTLTSGGFTCYIPINLSIAGTVKISGSWIQTALLTWSGATNFTYNSSSAETMTCNAGITMTSPSGSTSNTIVYLAGGTFTNATNTNYFYNPLVINPTYGNITIASSSYLSYRNSAILTYTASGTNTVTTTGSTLYLLIATTINTPIDAYFTGWGNVTLAGAVTYTLNSNLVANGLVTISSTAVVTPAAAQQVICNGGLTVSASSGTGTAAFVINGSGTLTGNNVTLTHPLIFNYAGTITLSSGGQGLTVASLVSFNAATSFTGAYNLYCNGGVTLNSNTGTTQAGYYLALAATQNLTSNGYSFNMGLFFSTGSTLTLYGAWIQNGPLYINNASDTINYHTSSAETFTLNGGIAWGASGGQVSGNATFIVGATQAWTGNNQPFNNPLIFNTTGTVTNSSNTTFQGLVSFNAATVLAGTGYFTIGTGSGLTLNSNTGISTGTVYLNITGTITLTSNGYTCSVPITLSNATTVQLLGSWNQTALLTWANTTNLNYMHTIAETMTCSGGITMTSVSGSTPTAVVYWTGGTFTCTSNAYYLYNPFYIQPSSSGVTIASGSYLCPHNATFVYVSTGYNVTVTGSTFCPSSAMTINVVHDAYLPSWANVYFNAAGIITLVSNIIASGLVTAGNSTTTNGYQVTCNGGLTITASTSGTTVFVINAAGTITGTGSLGNPLTFNTSGTCTVASGFTAAGLVTYNAPTILSGAYNITLNVGITLNSNTGVGSTTTFYGPLYTPLTLTSNGYTCYNPLYFTASGSYITTLVGNWINYGLVTINGVVGPLIQRSTNVSAETFTCAGGLTLGNATGAGTVPFILAGGTFTCTSSANNFLYPLTINPTVSNVTIASGSYLSYGNTSNALTYTHSGSNTVTATGAYLNIYTSTISINTDDGTGHIVWGTIQNTIGTTITLGSKLWCTTLNVGYQINVTGSYDISCSALVIRNYTSAAIAFNIPAGQSLLVSTSIDISGNRTYPITIQSNGYAQANLTYTGTQSNCIIVNTKFTAINASSSTNPIYNWGSGILYNTTNIYNITTADYLLWLRTSYLPMRGRM